MHIPKTAGSTFLSILRRQYHPESIFELTGDPERDRDRLRARRQGAEGSVELFVGHAPLDTGIEEADRASVITMFRDPIDRVISFCRHVSEGKSEYLLDDFPPASFDLDRFLGESGGELSNLQTKMLINRGQSASEDRLRSMSGSAALDLALERLTGRVAAFGIQEEFDASILLFAALGGWSLPLYDRRNVAESGGELEVTERHRDRIAELNGIDIALYESAVEILRARREEMGVDEKAVARFRTLNGAVAPLLSGWRILRLKTLYWYRRIFEREQYRDLLAREEELERKKRGGDMQDG